MRVLRCAPLDTRIHRPAATIAIVTFVVLVLELTSTRLYAYIGSSHATSTALSIALLGLGVGAFVRLRFPRWAEPRRAAPGLAAALFCLAAAAIGGASLPGLVALSLVPFALAGMLVSDAYASRGSKAARATYAVDLFAAASGCLVAPRLLGPLAPTEIMMVLGLLVLRAGADARRASRSHRGRDRADRGGARELAGDRARGIPARRAARGAASIRSAFREGDRRSRARRRATCSIRRGARSVAWTCTARPTNATRLGVFTDGMSPTYMVEEARAKAGSFESTWGLLMSLPYRALHPERVLVLGAGAGASVWLAKKYGASRVDAVEVNPAIPGLLARWKHFAGDVYHQPGVRLFIEDARRYLADTAERYDLIELALALTGNVHAQPSGMEAHLYTVEAVQLYLRRLTPTGVAGAHPQRSRKRVSPAAHGDRSARNDRRQSRASTRRNRRPARSTARDRVPVHAGRSHIADAARRGRPPRRRSGGAAVGPGRSAGAQCPAARSGAARRHRPTTT